MAQLTFEIASTRDADRAADLFLNGKELERAAALNLFKNEFALCEAHPNQRVYFLASANASLVAYADARFYDQLQDKNMYETAQLLPSGWYLRGLKVHPNSRRAGIARELTKRRLDWLIERTKTVFVFLNDEKKETLPMYRDFGFKTISRGWEFLSYDHKRQVQRGILLQLTWNE